MSREKEIPARLLDETTDWHVLEPSEILEKLETSERGLTAEEAAGRLQHYGPNELPHKPPPPAWQIFLHQFKSPLIYILLIAAIVSVVIDEPVDAIFIALVLLVNAVIGGYQEWRAERSAEALQQLLKTRTSVQRDLEIRDVDAEELVPGDIVLLESGDRVPADLRILRAHGLEIDESLLTGESIAVLKDADFKAAAQTSLGDRINMSYAGSTVVRGRMKAVVVGTGTSTVVGRLAVDVMKADVTRPPLMVRIERFTRVIAGAVLVAGAVIGGLAILLHDYSLTETFLLVVALAVSAIPEGLPVAMTVALSVATNRMAERGVIVRKLSAVEGLGSCTLVATDKTGTLTANEMMIQKVILDAGLDGAQVELTGQGFTPAGTVIFPDGIPDTEVRALLDRIARVAVLCNEAELHQRDDGWSWHGDPVDIAFLSLAYKLDWRRESALDRYPQVSEIPFEPERQFAASYHEADGRTMVFVKGAPERIISMSSAPAKERQRLLDQADSLAAEGYRVLGVAEGEESAELDPSRVPPEPEKLTLLGLVGMIDPLRSGVKGAVKACQQAGVRVTMVTGDHRITALAIARDLGFATSEDEVMTGAQLMEVNDPALADVVERTSVFARVAPDQKLRIVDAARKAGHFVAVTGDGVNDAPALRAAHIGVAMGKGGTDVAREAAELVISDDNFATIVSGIEQGRIAYDNIRKVIYLLVSTGAAEIILVTLAVVFGTPIPLLPVQILWLNLVTNGIQDVALAFEPGEEDALTRPPRPPNERIFNQLMIERTLIGAVVIGLVGFSTFWVLIGRGWDEAEARNILLLLMVLFENVHIGNCRSETKSALKLSPFKSPILLTGTISAFLIHLASMYLPATQIILGTRPVGLEVFAYLLLLALTVFVAIEIHKVTWKWRQGARRYLPRRQ